MRVFVCVFVCVCSCVCVFVCVCVHINNSDHFVTETLQEYCRSICRGNTVFLAGSATVRHLHAYKPVVLPEVLEWVIVTTTIQFHVSSNTRERLKSVLM